MISKTPRVTYGKNRKCRNDIHPGNICPKIEQITSILGSKPSILIFSRKVCHTTEFVRNSTFKFYCHTGIVDCKSDDHSTSSRQQAWPILSGWKSNMFRISPGLGTYNQISYSHFNIIRSMQINIRKYSMDFSYVAL